MRRAARLTGAFLIAGGVLLLAWALLVWQWQDPFTALYTHWEQGKLSHSLDREFADFRPQGSSSNLAAERRVIAADAAHFRRTATRGQAIGRIVIGRIGLKMVLVNGTDHDSLTKGPGRDTRSYMPGQNRLVYIAGHRTTYLAPFSHIDDIRPGDYVRLEMPYATFVYRATGHRIVVASDLSVLRSPRHEQLELQACHPRFFATHRYIVYAKLVSMQPRGGSPFAVSALAAGP
ncbi:MAG TPA: class E sortase [Gaiellaceae bacterium]|jgi:sortase A|nr:class E sortase [Gaiellaceae bacterium]